MPKFQLKNPEPFKIGYFYTSIENGKKYLLKEFEELNNVIFYNSGIAIYERDNNRIHYTSPHSQSGHILMVIDRMNDDDRKYQLVIESYLKKSAILFRL